MILLHHHHNCRSFAFYTRLSQCWSGRKPKQMIRTPRFSLTSVNIKPVLYKRLQELRKLFSVTFYCQVTMSMIVMISGSQLSEMSTSVQDFTCSYDANYSMSCFIAYKVWLLHTFTYLTSCLLNVMRWINCERKHFCSQIWFQVIDYYINSMRRHAVVSASGFFTVIVQRREMPT